MKKYAVQFGGVLSAVAATLVAFPAKATTLSTMFTDSLGTIENTYVDALTTNIPILIAAVIPIAVTMYFLYKGWAWIKRAAK